MRRTISWMTDGVSKEITVDKDGDYLTITMDNGDRMTMEYNRYYALGSVINEMEDRDELQVVSKAEFNNLAKETREALVPSLAKAKEVEVTDDEP